MQSAEDNERLIRVGPEAPMDRLMCCYWHPVVSCHELTQNPIKSIRILDEILTSFRDRRGRLSLVGQRCAQRAVDLEGDMPDEEGIRYPYRGWLYHRTGQCTDQSAESPARTWKR